MADRPYEVIIDGGGPWGFRLQGGKDFGMPLNIARVTPGSKAAIKQMNAGDIIHEINGINTENLNHMEAQNLIKNAGLRLQLKIKKGKGVSIGDQNSTAPKVLTETTVIHSAKVDHGFNSKPRLFGSPASSASPPAAPTSAPVQPPPTVSAPKFDPGAYARKKKEELEQRKKEQNIKAEDSEILKMINATNISKSPSPPPPPPQEIEDPAQPGAESGAFRMVYSGRDIHEEASPGSKSVISSLKEKVSQEKSGLNSESKVPSRVFQMLQKQLDEEDPEVSYPQDIMDALKERVETGATYRTIDANRYHSLPPVPPPPPPAIPRVDQQRCQMHAPTQGDAPPVDRNRVFKMTYDTRDIHAASIPVGSMNVMTSLKEKIAEKKNQANASYLPKKTPSRLHAMLEDQLGCADEGNIHNTNNQQALKGQDYEQQQQVISEQPFRRNIIEQKQANVFQAVQYSRPVERKETQRPDQPTAPEPEYERFRSDQGKHIPSKVFQALQHCYPGQGNEGMQQHKQPMEDQEYERFRGKQTNAVPSKVFQALQYSYPDEESSPQPDNMQFARSQNWEDENVGMRSSKSVPSKAFKMLQKQYSDEAESTAMTTDLQDALDLLEKELESMTTSKRNPVITVPLSKGIQKARPSNVTGPPSNSVAPQVPVRVDSAKFRIPPKLNEEDEGDEEDEEVMEAPMPIVQPPIGYKPRRHSSKSGDSSVMFAPKAQMNTGHEARHSKPHSSNSKNKDVEFLVAPLPHVERDEPSIQRSPRGQEKRGDIIAVAPASKIVAYCAEVETPWVRTEKGDKGRTNPALSMRNQNRRPSDHNNSHSNVKLASVSSERRGSAGGYKTRADSYDSTSSHSSQPDHIPAFDPDTYIVTRKSSLISSHGIRSNSTDSMHSFSSHASSQEPRYEDDAETKEPPSWDATVQFEKPPKTQSQSREANMPRRMVINVNGRARKSAEQQENNEASGSQERESDSVSSPCSSDADVSDTRERLPSAMKITISAKAVGRHKQDKVSSSEENIYASEVSERSRDDTRQRIKKAHIGFSDSDDAKFPVRREKEPQRMPTPLNNLQEMMNMFQVDAFEKEVERRGSGAVFCEDKIDVVEEEEACQQFHVEEEQENENDFSKLEELQLADLKSEEISEVIVEDLQPSLVSVIDSHLDTGNSKESFNGGELSQGKLGAIDLSKNSPSRPLTAVHVQSRKQQQQLSCTRSDAAANSTKERKKQPDKQICPPVNVQMQKNTRRCSMPIENLADDNRNEQLNLKKCQNSTIESSSPSKIPVPVSPSKHSSNGDQKNGMPSSPRPAPVRDDSIIVATEVSDKEELSAEKLQKTFEMINATADRILDQIDKVGSLGDFADEFTLDQYTADEDVFAEQQSDSLSSSDSKSSKIPVAAKKKKIEKTSNPPVEETVKQNPGSIEVRPRKARNIDDDNRISLGSDGSQRIRSSKSSNSSLSPSPRENGYHQALPCNKNQNNFDLNGDYRDYDNGKTNAVFEEVFSGSSDYPYRISKQVVSTVKRTSTGVKITMPAFSVKVTRGSPRSQDLPPPPPELIEEEEPARPSFGSSGPGQQSRTFRHLQESVATGEGHQSVFSRPPEDRNKAVPMPSQQPKPAAPQVTSVNPIPKAPMPTGPNFKISSAKAPSFKAHSPLPSSSQPSAYKSPNNAPAQSPPPSAPSFKPSTAPQPVNSPQTTTAKVPSAKQTMPVDPSRVPICHSCSQQIRGPFVSAIGKTWHPEHFCCDSCKKSLQNQGFVEEANKLYCEQCFNSFFAPKCASCGNSIIGNCINAVGKTYHPEHFLCEKCGKNFANEGFLIEIGKPYCEKCHDETFGVRCSGCSRSITGGQRYVEALNQNWHTDCFACESCHTRLEGSSFYVVNNRPFCGLHKSGM